MFTAYKSKPLEDIYLEFERKFNLDIDMKKYREYIKRNSYGYGEDAFYTMWDTIIKHMPIKFSFLEIGVYKGQILGLVSLLSNRYGRTSSIIGVTPLTSVGDKYGAYDDVDYKECILNLHREFSLKFEVDVQLYVGLSTDKDIQIKLRNAGPFDLIYIDGGHDYNTVVADIHTTIDIIKDGGIVVMDDSSNHKKLNELMILKPTGVFRGHLDVSNAVRDCIECDVRFTELICVGHNRVFQFNV